MLRLSQSHTMSLPPGEITEDLAVAPVASPLRTAKMGPGVAVAVAIVVRILDPRISQSIQCWPLTVFSAAVITNGGRIRHQCVRYVRLRALQHLDKLMLKLNIPAPIPPTPSILRPSSRQLPLPFSPNSPRKDVWMILI